MISSSHKLTTPTKNKKYQFHPSQFTDKERANHVITALKDYNKGIITNNPVGANLKFKKLTESAFVFLRGTADLMYRDLFGTDADKAMVLCMGDVHLENYGVMEADDSSLIWGLNDFDEANFAPFTWDIKRGATSVILAAIDSQRKKSFSKKKAKVMATAFAKAYMKTVMEEIKKKKMQKIFRKENSPNEIKTLLNKASKINDEKWLHKNYLDPESPTPRFINTSEIERIIGNEAKLQRQIQRSLNEYLKSLHIQKKKVPKKIKVWDVATKTGSGTGSIGLWRYYALIEAKDKKKSRKRILEIKQERKSVLDPYVGGGLLKFHSEGSRVAYAENIQLPNANPYYGYTEVGSKSYLVRERSPHKKRIVLNDLESSKSFTNYVEACGKALAFAHLQSDKTMRKVYPKIAEAIIHSVNPDTFSLDIGGFASKMADRVIEDWIFFKKAYKAGKIEC